MSDDIKIVVGAKNQASEILRNVGKATNDMAKQTSTAATVTKRSTDTMQAGFAGLQSAVAPLLAIVAAFKAITGGFSFLASSSEAFDTQEESVRSLTKALELNGNASQETIDNHKAYASSLQSLFNVGDEVTLGMMAQASAFGVADDQLQEVTRAAIGLAEATGISLDDAMKKVNGAINGNAGALAEYLPALNSVTSEEEKLAIVLQASEKGLAQKADRANTAAGAAERLSNTWGDFKEVVGQAIAPVRMLINSGLTVLVEVIQASVVPALMSILPTGEQVAAIMEYMRNAITKAITFVEVIVGNFPAVWQLLSSSVKLAVTQVVMEAGHAFTVVIPAYAKWFSDNFVNMISDAFNAAVTVVVNAASNMTNVIQILWGNIKSGFSGGFAEAMADISEAATNDLLKGFEAKTGELPKIAARQITAGERELMASIGGAATTLATEYEKKLTERMTAAGSNAGDSLLGSLKLSTAKIDDPLGEKKIGEDESIGTQAASAASQAASTLTATESRLLSRGKDEDYGQRTVTILERVDKSLQSIDKNIADTEAMPSQRMQFEVVV